MDLVFIRWDLVEPGYGPQPVLRITLDGAIASDPGTLDCFASPLAAAEAAWRVVGAAPSEGSWLDRAQDALDGAPGGSCDAAGSPPPRLVSSLMIGRGAVHWITGNPSLAPSGDWALSTAAGLDRARRSGDDGAPPTPLDASEEPLSGKETSEWVFFRQAGDAAGSAHGPPQPAALRPTLLGDDDGDLSGDATGEWTLGNEVRRLSAELLEGDD